MVTVHEYAKNYEFRSDDGDYTPTDAERAMIEDAVEGFLDQATRAETITLRTGQPVGEEW